MTAMTSYRALVRDLSRLDIRNFGTDFISTWDKTRDQLEATLLVAQILQKLQRDKIPVKLFDSGLAVSWFRDQSTRTRYSFRAAANLLGLGVEDFDERESQIAHGETTRETAIMLSYLTQVIGIRDDKYLGEGERFQKEVADAVRAGYEEGVLPQRPSIINLQNDQDHPTQNLSDLMHLATVFGGLKRLKGMKIVMSWAYSPSYGKPLSVAQGVVGLMTRYGMQVVLAHPKGYKLSPAITRLAAKQARKSGGSLKIVHDMGEAFRGADIVYPKSWGPYALMERRTRLYRKGDSAGLKRVERMMLSQNAKYKNWECSEAMLKRTKNGRALYLHCLPADISGLNCRTGEVSRTVFERYRRQLYLQAGYKPFIIAAMILMTKFEKPDQVLRPLLRKGKKRNI